MSVSLYLFAYNWPMNKLQIWGAALVLLVVLTACGTSSPFQPTGILSVSFSPSGAAPTTSVRDSNYKLLGEHVGDFTMTVPAGRVSLWITAEGYDSTLQNVVVAANDRHDVVLELVESLRATMTGFTVTRYSTAVATVSGFVAHNYSGSVDVRASCVEDGYPNVTTGLRGSAFVTVGEATTLTLRHSSGFSYFTSNTVRCSFYATVPGRNEVSVTRR